MNRRAPTSPSRKSSASIRSRRGFVLGGGMVAGGWGGVLVSTVNGPRAILPSVGSGRCMRKVSRKNQVQVGRLTTLLDEGFQGIRHVKAYVVERYESTRADEAIEEVFRLYQKSARVSSIIHPVMEALGGFAIDRKSVV